MNTLSKEQKEKWKERLRQLRILARWHVRWHGICPLKLKNEIEEALTILKRKKYGEN